MYPTQQEFEEMLLTRDIIDILRNVMFTGVPFSFAGQPEIYLRMVDHIATGLDVAADDVCVVGSARLGFSLAPDRFGTPFGEHSDIDVLVVSSELFDKSWLNILFYRKVPWTSLRPNTRKQIDAHREEHFVFRGWIYPDSISQALDIGNDWINTFNGLSTIPELSDMDIKGRLYRTWDHVEIYQRQSLNRLKNKITSNQQGS